MTNRELLDVFLMEKSLSSAPKTIVYYRENLERFYAFSQEHWRKNGEEIPYSELTKSLYYQYVLALRASGIKNVSLTTYHVAVRTFSNWLVENQCLEKSFTNVKLPRSDARPIEPLTQDEVEYLDKFIELTEHHDRNYLMFHLMLDCGLRRQEVLNLRWDDLHFSETSKYLSIKYSKYNKNRLIPVPDFLVQRFSCLPNHSGYCFQMEDKNQMTEVALKDMFNKLKKKSGIIRLHPHLLRHTFATSFVAGGGNLEYLRMYLGHASYAITQNYLHISFQLQICGIEIYKLDKVFFKNYNNN